MLFIIRRGTVRYVSISARYFVIGSITGKAKMGFGSGSCSFSQGNRSVNIAPISIIIQHLNYCYKCVYL